jgi:TIR domain-containing protein
VDVGVLMALLYMSYAHEDRHIAQEIAEQLRRRDVTVLPPQAGHVHNGLVNGAIEDAIGRADAFLALLSPSFLASAACRRERELALHREQRGRVAGVLAGFVLVLKVRDTPYHEAGPLGGWPWLEITTELGKDNALNDLVARLGNPGDAADPPGDGDNGADRLPDFRNRKGELDRILAGLTREDGQHFWLVIAPPQLGKSWFLTRVGEDVKADAPDRWEVTLVDVREQPPDVRASAETLLGKMFGVAPPAGTDGDDLRDLAIEVIRAQRFHLCLLDSAELLDKQVALRLRSCLSKVNAHIEEARNRRVRLALIVASRREDWLGITPKPRLQLLPLTEFKVDVMSEALQELSGGMELDFSSTELLKYAQLVHGLSEGLPALLYRYLDWIRQEQWTDLERLRQKRQFDQLTKPYIERELVSSTSLFGSGTEPTADQKLALEQALRVLVPYRIFTTAHLHHHAAPGGALHEVLGTLGWSAEDLWAAVSSTDLLYRPLKEPWQAIYAPIRRLLCRYWYSSDDRLAEAHLAAAEFVRRWANEEMGRDQSVVLVECLWHESQVLRLDRTVNAAETFTVLASELSRGLTRAHAYTEEILRSYAVDLMREDEELMDAAAAIHVSFDQLTDAVLNPAQEPPDD